MHLQSPKPKQQKFWFILKLLFSIVILISFAPGSVWAQTPEVVPQIVTAYDYAWPASPVAPELSYDWKVLRGGTGAWHISVFSPPTGFLISSVTQVQPVFAPPPVQQEPIKKYTGVTVINNWITEDGTLYTGCTPYQGPGELKLFEDGTFILDTTATEFSIKIVEEFTTCGFVQEQAEEFEGEFTYRFFGNYTNDSNILTFSSVAFVKEEVEIPYSDIFSGVIDLQGYGTFTDTTTEGEVSFQSGFGEMHIEFDLHADLPTPDCNASITLPANLNLGDDLWMTASYTDLDGNSLSSEAIISEAWIINEQAGVLLTSWDGNAMNIELQYTCPGGQAHTAVYNLPASQDESAPASPLEGDASQEEPLQEQQPEVDSSPEEPGQSPPENNNNTSLLVPLVMVAIAVIGGGAVLGGGAIIYVIAKNSGKIGGKPKIPAIRKPPVTTSPQPHQPPASQLPSPQPPEPREPQPHREPERKKLGPEEKARLEGIRNQIQADIEARTKEYQQLKKDRERKTRLLKKNMLKFLGKQALETAMRILFPAKKGIDIIYDKLTPEKLKLFDRLFEKHDTSQDGKIIVDMKKQIDQMKGEEREIIKDVIQKKRAVIKTDQQLGMGN